MIKNGSVEGLGTMLDQNTNSILHLLLSLVGTPVAT